MGNIQTYNLIKSLPPLPPGKQKAPAATAEPAAQRDSLDISGGSAVEKPKFSVKNFVKQAVPVVAGLAAAAGTVAVAASFLGVGAAIGAGCMLGGAALANLAARGEPGLSGFCDTAGAIIGGAVAGAAFNSPILASTALMVGSAFTGMLAAAGADKLLNLVSRDG